MRPKKTLASFARAGFVLTDQLSVAKTTLAITAQYMGTIDSVFTFVDPGRAFAINAKNDLKSEANAPLDTSPTIIGATITKTDSAATITTAMTANNDPPTKKDGEYHLIAISNIGSGYNVDLGGTISAHLDPGRAGF